MQLYLIEYQTHWQTHVDLGRCVALAESPDHAARALVVKYKLPASRTHCKVEPVPDGSMLLTKRSVAHESASAPRNNNIIGFDRYKERPSTLIYNCQILGVASGYDENHALKRLAHAVINRCNDQAGDQDRHVTRLMVTCEPRVAGHEKV